MEHRISRRTLLAGSAGLGLFPRSSTPDPAGPANCPEPAPAVEPLRAEHGLIALRRDLHRHPEGPGQERRTAAVVAGRLRAAGLDVTTGVGGHGVVGVLAGARPGRTVAYRADMDAVPPGDQIGGGPEPAHLCGHDLHTTIGVGVAEALARRRRTLGGSVVFVFQPAEETLTGAAAMLADGLFAHTRPAEIHALHCAPIPTGRIMVTPGVGLPGRDAGTVTLDSPEAATRLAERLTALSTVARPETPEQLERLWEDLATAGGPLAEFVVVQASVRPDNPATVRINARCWPEQRYTRVREEIRRLAAPATVDFPTDPFPAMVCPPAEALELRRHLGSAEVAHAAIPFSGEDFALFLKEMPGTYSFLGVRGPKASITSSYPHFGTFAPDERAIGHGVRAMTGWLASRAVSRG
ncbi:M20 family metallopeptidase [Catenuloplanes sp. NPDC051500]|uniref:M20 family metallopeptidase n=1 Tax=Catenuloplanes sp. NPDC051500 TaxID=3363959 RepID=UPI0037AA8865